jgi:O-succinylbenzoic acid--CoA ligase
MPEFRRVLDSAAEAYGTHPFLRTPSGSVKYSEFRAAIDRVSGNLLKREISASDRIGVVAENSIQTVITILSLINIGAVACPISVRFPQLMIETIARKHGLRAIVTDRPEHLPENIPCIFMNEVNEQTGSESPRIEFPNNPHRIATVMLTSGSTATPKGVAQTFGQHYHNAVGANRNIPFEPGDRWLMSLPLYHVGGLAIVVRALVGGGAVIFPEQAETLVWNIKRLEISHLSVVNTQLREMLKSETVPGALDSLKAVIVGGEPQDQTLLANARKAGWPIATTYGLTEIGSMVTCSRPERSEKAVTQSGRLLDHREMKLSSDHEILVRGDCLMSGYLDGEHLRLPVDTDGWFHTGDLGRIDELGQLEPIGRRDNMFVSGGENIHPELIEAELLKISGIEEVMVVPVADQNFGERPVAFVRFDTDPTYTLESLAEMLQDTLPRFMIPVRFHPWPRTLQQAGLKVSRTRLKQIARELADSTA